MLAPKRFLPSISALMVFESAARNGSFSAAAEELCLTQGAISRQIKSLEHQLGTKLFVRESQGVAVTEAGSQYADSVRGALLLIANASMNLKASPENSVLNLACDSAVASRLVIPKLQGFLNLNPNTGVNLVGIDREFDFAEKGIDLAISSEIDGWEAVDSKYFVELDYVPICSVSFAQRWQVNQSADVLEVPLLHMTYFPDAWEHWLTEQGVTFAPLTGMLIDNLEGYIRAAINGLGVALLPQILVREELESGRLIQLLPHCVLRGHALSVVWPSQSPMISAINAFCDYICKSDGTA